MTEAPRHGPGNRAAAVLLARAAELSLGGTAGDVYGALIEVATITALLASALLYY